MVWKLLGSQFVVSFSIGEHMPKIANSKNKMLYNIDKIVVILLDVAFVDVFFDGLIGALIGVI
jgi:hypothetical protein